MLGSSRVAAQLAASREGLGSMSDSYVGSNFVFTQDFSSARLPTQGMSLNHPFELLSFLDFVLEMSQLRPLVVVLDGKG
jgi:hypothetical protein